MKSVGQLPPNVSCLPKPKSSGLKPKRLFSLHKNPLDSPDRQCRHPKRAKASPILEGSGEGNRSVPPGKCPHHAWALWTKEVLLQGMRRFRTLHALAAERKMQGVRGVTNLLARAEERRMQGVVAWSKKCGRSQVWQPRRQMYLMRLTLGNS
jgi:hypothetical protein